MSRLTEHSVPDAGVIDNTPTSSGRKAHGLAGKPSNHRHTSENFADRFWRKVERQGPDDCWLWTGGTNSRGRGLMHLRWEGGKNVRRHASLVAWELTHGPVPDGLQVCHNCPSGDQSLCCNPAHLFLGTQYDNIHDCIHKSRRNAFGRQRLHPPHVREIKALLRAGRRQRDIAARFGVSRSAIAAIAIGASWSHLNDHPALDRLFERVPVVYLPIRGEVS
jgi:hypothetical protein